MLQDLEKENAALRAENEALRERIETLQFEAKEQFSRLEIFRAGLSLKYSFLMPLDVHIIAAFASVDMPLEKSRMICKAEELAGGEYSLDSFDVRKCVMNRISRKRCGYEIIERKAHLLYGLTNDFLSFNDSLIRAYRKGLHDV